MHYCYKIVTYRLHLYDGSVMELEKLLYDAQRANARFDKCCHRHTNRALNDRSQAFRESPKKRLPKSPAMKVEKGYCGAGKKGNMPEAFFGAITAVMNDFYSRHIGNPPCFSQPQR